MPTEKQLAANRANALKSTGPRTPEGKAASSRNAVRHDLLDRHFILASECPARFETFAAAFYEEYQPTTPTETALVDTMSTARWRLIRMSNIEAGLIDHEYISKSGPENAALTIPARTTLAWRTAAESGRSLETLNRTQSRLQHEFNSALDRLQGLRRRGKTPSKSTTKRVTPKILLDPVIAPQLPVHEQLTGTTSEK